MYVRPGAAKDARQCAVLPHGGRWLLRRDIHMAGGLAGSDRRPMIKGHAPAEGAALASGKGRGPCHQSGVVAHVHLAISSSSIRTGAFPLADISGTSEAKGTIVPRCPGKKGILLQDKPNVAQNVPGCHREGPRFTKDNHPIAAFKGGISLSSGDFPRSGGDHNGTHSPGSILNVSPAATTVRIRVAEKIDL